MSQISVKKFQLNRGLFPDEAPLVLADSDQVNETDSIYSLGYPTISVRVQDVALFTKENEGIQTGIIKYQKSTNYTYVNGARLTPGQERCYEL